MADPVNCKANARTAERRGGDADQHEEGEPQVHESVEQRD
jgi:hypothetical protein